MKKNDFPLRKCQKDLEAQPEPEPEPEPTPTDVAEVADVSDADEVPRLDLDNVLQDLKELTNVLETRGKSIRRRPLLRPSFSFLFFLLFDRRRDRHR